MSYTLLNHHSSISIGGRDALISDSNDELQQLTNSLSKHASDYDIEISSEKSKSMVNRDEIYMQISE